MMSPEIELGISRTEGHELTNFCLLQPKFFLFWCQDLERLTAIFFIPHFIYLFELMI